MKKPPKQPPISGILIDAGYTTGVKPHHETLVCVDHRVHICYDTKTPHRSRLFPCSCAGQTKVTLPRAAATKVRLHFTLNPLPAKGMDPRSELYSVHTTAKGRRA